MKNCTNALTCFDISVANRPFNGRCKFQKSTNDVSSFDFEFHSVAGQKFIFTVSMFADSKSAQSLWEANLVVAL